MTRLGTMQNRNGRSPLPATRRGRGSFDDRPGETPTPCGLGGRDTTAWVTGRQEGRTVTTAAVRRSRSPDRGRSLVWTVMSQMAASTPASDGPNFASGRRGAGCSRSPRLGTGRVQHDALGMRGATASRTQDRCGPVTPILLQDCVACRSFLLPRVRPPKAAGRPLPLLCSRVPRGRPHGVSEGR